MLGSVVAGHGGSAFLVLMSALYAIVVGADMAVSLYVYKLYNDEDRIGVCSVGT